MGYSKEGRRLGRPPGCGTKDIEYDAARREIVGELLVEMLIDLTGRYDLAPAPPTLAVALRHLADHLEDNEL